MGVQVKLADAREIDGKQKQAGEVVTLEPGEARVLVAVGAGVLVDDKTPTKKPAEKQATDKTGTAGQKG